MTARQQIARLLPLVLLVVLVIAGLRGAVPTPRWDGPLKADGIAIGIAIEVVFGALLFVILSRDGRARRAEAVRPYNPADADKDIEPARALRFTLEYVLLMAMIAVAAVLIADLHLHFFVSHRIPKTPLESLRPVRQPTPKSGGGGSGSFNIPIGPILYGLLIAAIVLAIAVSIWWSTRLRRPAAPLVIEDVSTEELRAAVAEGRAALEEIDDARAAIIACYVAMERRLADRGTARGAADTPDELLARAVAGNIVRGAAAGRLTTLFYEARFSTHPLGTGQRDAARTALDELAGELSAKPAPAAEPAGQPTGTSQPPKPGGGWV